MRNKLLKAKSHQKNLISLKVKTMILARNQKMRPRMLRRKPKRRKNWSRRKRRKPLIKPLLMQLPRKKRQDSSHQS